MGCDIKMGEGNLEKNKVKKATTKSGLKTVSLRHFFAKISHPKV